MIWCPTVSTGAFVARRNGKVFITGNSGFPKSLDVSKAIDKMDAADEQERRRLAFTAWVRSQGVTSRQIDEATGTNMGGHYTTAASQPAIMTREHLEACRHLFRDVPEWVEREADQRTVESENFKRREVVGQDTKARSTAGASALPTMGGETVYQTWDITAPATDAARQWQGWGTSLKPSLEPVTVARKPLMSPSINVLKAVESQLRERGVRGEILWKPESASGAAKKKPRASSSSTEVRQVEETFAATAGVKETQRDGLKTETSFAPSMPNGAMQTEIMSVSTTSENETGYETKCSPLTAENAPVAEKLSAISSPSTTSMEEAPSIGSQSMGRSTTSSSEKDSQLDTECFAGIATGLTGSTAHVHIKRDSSGFYLWPKGLPEFAPGTPLTVAENVLAHGTGALNIDGCRVEAPGGRPLIVGDYKQTDNNAYQGRMDGSLQGGSRHEGETTLGRWPANLIHSGDDEVTGLLGSAARFFYCAKASKRDRGEGNTHPTVKPTDLMAYLCRLVTPPGGTVLDPFMGSGSTGKAAMREGFRFVGIEREAEYLAIARARIYGAVPAACDLFSASNKPSREAA